MYVDTSIAIKLYLHEDGSDKAQKAVADVGALSCAEILIPEFRSALNRKASDGESDREENDTRNCDYQSHLVRPQNEIAVRVIAHRSALELSRRHSRVVHADDGRAQKQCRPNFLECHS